MIRQRALNRWSFCGALILALAPTLTRADLINFDRPDPAPGNLRFTWIHGSLSAKDNQDVRIQVHRYNEHTYILRQNPAIHWEAPFMYLLFGNDRAVLFDSGATENAAHFPLRDTVDRVISRWLAANNKAAITLYVVPLGSDPSQLGALPQFADRPDTVVVPARLASRQSLLASEGWPDSAGSLDLGGRKLTLLATPGLNPDAMTAYDPWSDLLLTGNSLYPGRLVIRDFESYSSSLSRLTALANNEPIKWVFGGRIEMTQQPGLDYRLRSNYRPFEHPLQLAPEQLQEAAQIVQLINGAKDIRIHDHFIVMNGVGRGARDYGYPVFIPEQFRAPNTR